jgi:ribonuclease PH
MPSSGETSFIVDGVLQNLRSDGRSCDDFRPIAIDLDVVLTANGSARCQIGGTSVIVAVKASSQGSNVRVLSLQAAASRFVSSSLHWSGSEVGIEGK